ncbi:SDR family NAD(P)-dependent oxidoreductase [Streptomyces misionensis]|uniref:SDR family NAD(P)-dependent oxidoreductase n=1 Tax=Streptomyces misionensis TaxID=67331 RepID=UPI0033BA5B73
MLAEQGADVAFTYVSSEKQAQAVVDEVHGKEARAVGFKSDQADTSRATVLINDVVAHFGGLDILVNNATISVEQGRRRCLCASNSPSSPPSNPTSPSCSLACSNSSYGIRHAPSPAT